MKWLVAALIVAFLLAAQPAHATRLSDNSLASPEHRINCAAPCWPANPIKRPRE